MTDTVTVPSGRGGAHRHHRRRRMGRPAGARGRQGRLRRSMRAGVAAGGARRLCRCAAPIGPPMAGGHGRDAHAARGAAALAAATPRCSTAGPISPSSRRRERCGIRRAGAIRTRAGMRSLRAEPAQARRRRRSTTDEDQPVLQSRPSARGRLGAVRGRSRSRQMHAWRRAHRGEGRRPLCGTGRHEARALQRHVRGRGARHAGCREPLRPRRGQGRRQARRQPLQAPARLSVLRAGARRDAGRYRCGRAAVRPGGAVRPHRHHHRNREHPDRAVRAERRGAACRDAGGAGAGGRGDRAGSGGAAIAALRSQGRALPRASSAGAYQRDRSGRQADRRVRPPALRRKGALSDRCHARTSSAISDAI